MAAAENLKLTQIVDKKVTTAINGMSGVFVVPFILNVNALVRRKGNASNGPATGEQRG